MKLIKIAGMTLMGILAGIAGLMTITNPGRGDYERYAVEKLSTYLKDDVCNKAQGNKDVRPFLRNSCKTLVDTGRPQIQQIIAINTTRQNFLLFSIYQTELSLPAPISGYQFATVGVGQNFFTYQAEKI
jgi:hypothetical protein